MIHLKKLTVGDYLILVYSIYKWFHHGLFSDAAHVEAIYTIPDYKEMNNVVNNNVEHNDIGT